MSATLKPDYLSAFRAGAYTNLMKISPKGSEKIINQLKVDFPKELGSVNAYTDKEINNFDSEKLNLYFKNKEVLTNSFLESE